MTTYDLFSGIPPHQDTRTSIDAAQGILDHVGRLQREVYACIYRSGKFGRTDLEIEAELDIGGSTVRPRRRELELKGLIVKARVTRQTPSGRSAKVWIAV